ncbi:MAG TPA: lysophospholipid acyltransferase family protein [Acidimicrobiia bacterium]|nr:lysophospholipid acyltransferase family protein [Acidimicrobiia bacterium]
MSRGFPLRAPTWPGTVPRPPAPSRTGVDFDTAWARKPAARLARAALIDLAIRPAVTAIASPAVDGRERLDALDAPVIFAANHHSHIDTGLLLSLLPERFRRQTVVAAAADYFFDRRAKGTLHALAFGAVPMERTKVNRRSAEMALELLAGGWSLVIFPEGGRSPDGWAQEFRGGAAYLAVRSGRPVVPVYLDGTRHVWPKGQRLPRPYKVTVTFGTPLSPDSGEDARRLAGRIERSVAALADERASDWWTARRRAAAGDTPSITGPDAASWRRAWALGPR